MNPITKASLELWKEKLQEFVDGELSRYIDGFDDSGTNPPTPLPPKPPHATEE